MALAVRRRLRGVTAAALSISSSVAIAACTLFVDSSGLSGGGPAPDGAPLLEASIADANGAEAAVDADGSTSNDAQADAPPPTWCSDKTAILCDDFDGTSLGAQWTELSMAGGTIALDTGHHRSPPNALRVTASSASAQLGLFKTLTTINKRVKLAADVRSESVGAGNVDYLTFLAEIGGDTEIFLGFVYDDIHRVELGIFPDHPAGFSDAIDFAFPLNEWHRVELELDLTNAIALARIDGVVIGSAAIPSHAQLNGLSAGVGILFGDELTGQWKMRFDNVTLEGE